MRDACSPTIGDELIPSTHDDGSTVLARALMSAGFGGQIVSAGDPAYDAARTLFNRRVERRPAVIARCSGVDDVRSALAVAADHGLPLTVRGAGHSIAGWSCIENAVVIDLALMRAVHVDPETETAWVGAGASASDAVVRAAAFGLAPVTGVGPDVSLGGLLTGLGEGYLSLRHGFGTDNVLAFEVVTADGRVRHVSRDHHPDLFWAMRGAGANFGVVTAMKVRLHPCPEQAVGGWITFGDPDVAAVTPHVWDMMRNASRWFFPRAVYEPDEAGRLRVRIVLGHVGPPELARQEVEQVRSWAKPVLDEVRTMSYVDLIHDVAAGTEKIAGIADEDVVPTRRAWDIYRFDFDAPREPQMELLLQQAAMLTPFSHLNLWRTVLAGPPSTPSAAPRLPGINVFLSSRWHKPEDDDEQLRWMRDTAAAFARSGLVGEAGNSMNHTYVCEQPRVRRLYGDEGYRRLRTLKAAYDSTNRFRFNYNIPPAEAGQRAVDAPRIVSA